MTSQAVLFAVLFATTIALLIQGKIAPHRVFAYTALMMLITGLIDLSTIKAATTNSGVITLTCILVASLAIEQTQVMKRLSNWIFKDDQTNSILPRVKLFLGASFLSSWMSNTAVVASMIAPIKQNNKIAPNKLLLPLSYTCIAAGTTTLIGTSTNLIVNAQLIEKTGNGLGFFDFTIIGLAALLAVFIVSTAASYLLPDCISEESDDPDYYIEATVPSSSPIIGMNIIEAKLRSLDNFYLVHIIRNNEYISPVRPTSKLREGDKLVFVGDVSKIDQLVEIEGLSTFAQGEGFDTNELVEAMIRPSSAIAGQTLKQVGFRARYDAAVVAIKREGHALKAKLGNAKLVEGDILVLAKGSDFEKRRNILRNFLLLSNIQIQERLSKLQNLVTMPGLAAAAVSSALGLIDLATAMVIYLGFLVMSKAVKLNDVRQRLPIDILTIVISALCIAAAFVNSGAANILTNSIETTINGYPPFMMICILYLLTLITTELITNNAAAALITPIGLAISQAIGIAPLIPILAIAFGASASFINPFGYQTNLLAFNSGQYRFKHFLLVGSAASIAYSAAVLTLIYQTMQTL